MNNFLKIEIIIYKNNNLLYKLINNKIKIQGVSNNGDSISDTSVRNAIFHARHTKRHDHNTPEAAAIPIGVDLDVEAVNNALALTTLAISSQRGWVSSWWRPFNAKQLDI